MSDDPYRLEWQPIYAHCKRCDRMARFTIDTARVPLLGGKVGIVCAFCGDETYYNFHASPGDEVATQAKRKPEADANEAKLPSADDWQQFHAAMLGLMPQPKEGEEEPWQPDERTLTWWKSLRLQAQEEYERAD